MSLTADGKLVAFTLQATAHFKAAAYVLAANAAAGPLLARSREILAIPDHGLIHTNESVITPDGRALYFTVYGRQNQVTMAFQWQLIKADVATGRTRVVARGLAYPSGTLAADTSGAALLVVAHPPVRTGHAATTLQLPTPSPSPSPTGSPVPSPTQSPSSARVPERLVLINLGTGAVRYLSAATPYTIYFW